MENASGTTGIVYGCDKLNSDHVANSATGTAIQALFEERKVNLGREIPAKIIAMFERYSEAARRVIFLARYEAGQFGSRYIESEHLLLGWMREDKTLMYGLLTQEDVRRNIRLAVESRYKFPVKIREKADLPLSRESRFILASAARHANERSDEHIGTEHLLLGLLSKELFLGSIPKGSSVAAKLLKQYGVTMEKVSQQLKTGSSV